jgi:hypothetical protein
MGLCANRTLKSNHPPLLTTRGSAVARPFVLKPATGVHHHHHKQSGSHPASHARRTRAAATCCIAGHERPARQAGGPSSVSSPGRKLKGAGDSGRGGRAGEAGRGGGHYTRRLAEPSERRARGACVARRCSLAWPCAHQPLRAVPLARGGGGGG